MSKDGFDPDISHHYEIVDLESIIDKDAHMNGFDKDGYDKMGYDKSGYDKNNFDFEGYHRVTGTKFNYYNIDKRGFNDTGIHGVTGTKFDENDFDVDGIHKVTGTLYDEDGFHANGLNEDGCDKDGYDEYCVDKNNFNRIVKRKLTNTDIWLKNLLIILLLGRGFFTKKLKRQVVFCNLACVLF